MWIALDHKGSVALTIVTEKSANTILSENLGSKVNTIVYGRIGETKFGVTFFPDCLVALI